MKKIMRVCVNVCLVLAAAFACNPGEVRTTGEQTFISFVSSPARSQSLYARPTLKFNPNDTTMELSLKLKSLVPQTLRIEQIVLNNGAGINSSPTESLMLSLKIPNDNDTTVQLAFKHIHDKSLFYQTGLPGPLDSTYNVAVVYSVEGKKDARSINLVCRMRPQEFASYRKTYDQAPLQVYFFNTADGFAEKQAQYLIKEQLTNTPPFVHVTEQEVALCGLNFKAKCFMRNDTLYSEIFVVNHSDFTVKIDSSKIDLIADALPDLSRKKLTVKKVTGMRHETNVLRKGDRIIFTLKKYFDRDPDQMRLTFAESFFFSSGKPLFFADFQLVKARKIATEAPLASRDHDG